MTFLSEDMKWNKLAEKIRKSYELVRDRQLERGSLEMVIRIQLVSWS